MTSGTVVDNKFIGGLKTEFTGINFPDDSCTETFDCHFGRTGIVSRRLGFDHEAHAAFEAIDPAGLAVSSYFWKNVIGDSTVSIVVVQVGGTLYFYRSSSATLTSPLSAQKLASTVVLSTYLASGASSVDTTKECQYADGNGYLFIFHKDCDPIAVSYSAGTLTGSAITIRIRDFGGVLEDGVEDTFRSSSLTSNHQYNLQNQGWTTAAAWGATSTTSNNTNTGSHTWTIQTGLTISGGQIVTVGAHHSSGFDVTESGTVTSYNSGSGALVLNITSTSLSGLIVTSWTFFSSANDNITTWHTAVGNYPSNSDVWWLYKNASNVFDPATTYNNVTINAGPAPKGHYILDAFNQKRSTVSGVSGPSDVTTGGLRPTTGTFFAGRIWYTGVNFLGFNENLYFSQIIERSDQFGKCYQINDPTSEDRADLLPSDGGVFKVQGAGTVYKLFPIINGLLVFAERGVWLLTGSSGIGFTATDFTLVKISNVPTISATSFVDVLGLPMWCNEDGIYTVTPQQQGNVQQGNQHLGLTVNPITYGTIASFYQDIPLISKIYMRGYFNYLDYKVQWIYRSSSESNVTTRYTFTNILNLDTITNAFYPWTISTSTSSIKSILALGGSGGLTSPLYTFKYLTYNTNSGLTFSEEIDTNYVDWDTPGVAVDYTSYFITGYRVYTKGNTLGQLPYIDIHAVGGGDSQCSIQSRWDYTTSGDEGRWSSVQRVLFDATNRAYQTKRRRTRGRGRAVQLKFSSISGHPMSIIGWSTLVEVNPKP